MEYLLVEKISIDTVKNIIPKRDPKANKGDFGKLFCICGSVGMSGAAVMSAKAALRCGVGIANIAVPKSIYGIIAGSLYEPIFTVLDETPLGTFSYSSIKTILDCIENSTGCLIGCGIKVNDDTTKIVEEVIKNSGKPIIIDADGINIISKNIDILKQAKSHLILTPHPGEMSRLLNATVDDVQTNRIEYAKRFAVNNKLTLILKGADTVVASKDGKVYINKTGNPGMAKGGSGDILAGMIASFVAQGISPLDAAVCAVYLHACAGDDCASKLSQTAMLPTDIINELPELFLKIQR